MIEGTTRASRTGYETVPDEVYAEIAERFAGLCDLDSKRLLPAILGELARLGRMELTPLQRFDLLEPLGPLIRHARARLPKPLAGAERGSDADGEPPTVEQHLYLLLVENLQLLLRDLDRPRYLAVEGRDAKRRWAQVRLMKTLGRQIYYAGSNRRRVPSGTWRALHDLFIYLVMRSEVRLQSPGRAPRIRRGFQFEPAYKALLLLGFYDGLAQTARGGADGLPPLDPALVRQCSQWAFETWLIDPDGLLERTDLILVETGKDAPPRLESAILHDPFGGWVLIPARGFLDLLARGGTALPHHLPSVAG
ncbi:hypothetical protein [Thiococcus pfennigii]|uniref:hypothetical protein n=1 Tax=Thiococcus pfennigii TaxID=1057 RepID=UPI0019066C27|nr:hypothetical protein [Thiococcus pfennigii]MBK1700029.1 hypothetical protein [Thiococcus pfennigii]